METEWDLRLNRMETLDRFLDGELTVDEVIVKTGLTPTELGDMYNV